MSSVTNTSSTIPSSLPSEHKPLSRAGIRSLLNVGPLGVSERTLNKQPMSLPELESCRLSVAKALSAIDAQIAQLRGETLNASPKQTSSPSSLSTVEEEKEEEEDLVVISHDDWREELEQK